jgi:NAD(P)-dependent dehydrogenase (short-subunit alcohol dehydrogenase family)
MPPPEHSPAVVLVTGASSGIGRATALAAAERGDDLVLVARSRGTLEQVATDCRLRGAGSVGVHALDVADDDAVARLVEEVLVQHDRIDTVVHAAGVVAYGRVEQVPADVFDRVIRTNLLGSAAVARHVVPVLREQGAGSLVLVGSVIGHITVPGMAAYAVSKHGVRALAAHLRLENRDLPGVRIAYAAPGGVDTPIYQQAATYAGFVGRPPPPVFSPELTARQLLRRAEHRLPAQLNPANDVIRLGATFLPWVYDRLVGPLFGVIATDLTRPTPPTTGNVLAPSPAGNRLRGTAGPTVAGVLANLRRRVRGAVPAATSPHEHVPHPRSAAELAAEPTSERSTT